MNRKNINYSKLIVNGLQIETPKIFVPWNTKADDITTIFKENPIDMVVPKYYVLRRACIFETLSCNIGFHFDLYLSKIEFFRDKCIDLEVSYIEFQKVFERAFGKPTIIHHKRSCEWIFNENIKIFHLLMDRFGFEEHLFIEKGHERDKDATGYP